MKVPVRPRSEPLTRSMATAPAEPLTEVAAESISPLLVASRSTWNVLSMDMRARKLPPVLNAGSKGVSFRSKRPTACLGERQCADPGASIVEKTQRKQENDDGRIEGGGSFFPRKPWKSGERMLHRLGLRGEFVIAEAAALQIRRRDRRRHGAICLFRRRFDQKKRFRCDG
jgi:hypothetical protein